MFQAHSEGDSAFVTGRGMRDDAGTPMQRGRDFARASRTDRLLAPNEEAPLGSHLITPRLGFVHHGIYVGSGRVVHYGALVHQLIGGPVEEVPIARFAQGHIIRVRFHATQRFDPAEVIRRARARVGEDRYRLLTNNCEHFCEWCLHGEHRSYQIEKVLLLRFARRQSA